MQNCNPVQSGNFVIFATLQKSPNCCEVLKDLKWFRILFYRANATFPFIVQWGARSLKVTVTWCPADGVPLQAGDQVHFVILWSRAVDGVKYSVCVNYSLKTLWMLSPFFRCLLGLILPCITVAMPCVTVYERTTTSHMYRVVISEMGRVIEPWRRDASVSAGTRLADDICGISDGRPAGFLHRGWWRAWFIEEADAGSTINPERHVTSTWMTSIICTPSQGECQIQTSHHVMLVMVWCAHVWLRNVNCYGRGCGMRGLSIMHPHKLNMRPANVCRHCKQWLWQCRV